MPAFLWLLALVPLVVVLHFVRSRRRRRDVAALFLWRRARQAAQRQRRFAPTWLLVAQVMFVALAALALARPQWGGGVAPDRVVILDASASMVARDSEGVRFSRAKDVASGLLAGAGRVAIVRAGLDARVVAPLTSDRALLRAALAELRPGDRAADLGRALSLAESIEAGAEVHLITDQPAPGGRVRYHGVAGDGVNVGISTFELGIQQAYVGIVSNSSGPVQVGVTLTNAGQPVASADVLVPAGGVGSVTFPLDTVAGVYEARIAPPAGDALSLDDVAYAGSRNVAAVLERADEATLKALAAVPGVSVRAMTSAATATADLRVLVRTSAEGLEPGAYMLFAPAAVAPDYQTIQQWDRGDPLLRFADLRDVVVGLEPGRPAWAEGEGWRVLASTGALEPVLRFRDVDGVRVLQFAFHPSQTDLVLRAAYPALLANLVRLVRGDLSLGLGDALPVGARSLPDQASVPEGAWVLEPGVYRSGATTLLANLTSESESRLSGPAAVANPVERAPLVPSAAAEPTVEGAGALRSVAIALIGLAVLALLAEWLLWSGVSWGPLRRRSSRDGA